MMKILVVEDDADLREMMSELLQGAGHSVTRAEDGNQGKSHDRPGGLHQPSLRKQLIVNEVPASGRQKS